MKRLSIVNDTTIQRLSIPLRLARPSFYLCFHIAFRLRPYVRTYVHVCVCCRPSQCTMLIEKEELYALCIVVAHLPHLFSSVFIWLCVPCSNGTKKGKYRRSDIRLLLMHTNTNTHCHSLGREHTHTLDAHMNYV